MILLPVFTGHRARQKMGSITGAQPKSNWMKQDYNVQKSQGIFSAWSQTKAIDQSTGIDSRALVAVNQHKQTYGIRKMTPLKSESASSPKFPPATHQVGNTSDSHPPYQNSELKKELTSPSGFHSGASSILTNQIMSSVGFAGAVKWECNLCDKAYATRGGLQEHMKRHKGVYRYNCDICCKGFQVKDNYEGHMNSHMDYRPYACEKCQKSFSFRRSLMRHQINCMNTSESFS